MTASGFQPRLGIILNTPPYLDDVVVVVCVVDVFVVDDEAGGVVVVPPPQAARLPSKAVMITRAITKIMIDLFNEFLLFICLPSRRFSLCDSCTSLLGTH